MIRAPEALAPGRTSMRRHLIAAALTAASAALATPAQACAVHEALNPNSARSADLVVVGRAVNPRVGRDGTVGFTLAVGEVLRGRAGHTVAVRYEFPDRIIPPILSRSPLLLALRARGAGPFVIMQHMCSDPFVLDAGSRQGLAARRALEHR
jgi:hypothetical protein